MTHIVVAGIDDQWSADIMDMVKFSKYNDGFAYVLVVIDVLSKYLWLHNLKYKKEIRELAPLRISSKMAADRT